MMKKSEENQEETPNFPFEIKALDKELNEQLLKDFTGERTGYVQVGPKKWLFGSVYAKEAANYYNFQVRHDDVCVVTFPRSGTTLVQEMVWLLENNLNYEKAAKIPLVARFPFLELSSILPPKIRSEILTKNSNDPRQYQMAKEIGNSDSKVLEETSDKRFIKTHLPFSLLPPNLIKAGCKVVYVARNPKDVAVSFYHLNRLMKSQGYTGDFPKHWDYFERNLLLWTPYWEHIKDGWENRNNENVLFLFYENINKDLKGAIAQVSEFLGKGYTNDQIERLEDHLKIENFRHNKSINFDDILGITNKGEENFIRKGKNGGWKDYFDDELNARADDWIAKNLRNIPDFSFPDITK